MYNEFIKSRFINSEDKEGSRKNFELLFERIEKYESEFSKDVCQMSEQEVSEVMNDISAIRGGTNNKSTRVRMLEKYVKWCNEQEIENSNLNILAVKADSTAKILKTMVKSPAHLEDILNSIFTPLHKNTIDNIYRCYIWLVYMGVDKDNVNLVKRDDVSIENKKIILNGISYAIYPEAIDAIKSCMDLKELSIHHPNYNQIGFEPRAEGESIARGSEGLLSPMIIQKMITRKTNKKISNGIDVPKLKMKAIELSGIFYRIMMLEKEGQGINFSGIVLRNLEGKKMTDSVRNYTFNYKCSEYESEYKRWKDVFYNN